MVNTFIVGADIQIASIFILTHFMEAIVKQETLDVESTNKEAETKGRIISVQSAYDKSFCPCTTVTSMSSDDVGWHGNGTVSYALRY